MTWWIQGFIIAIWVVLNLIYFRLGRLIETRQTIKTNIFDEEELHNNCTVQILKNTQTGETSTGWWENEGSMH